MTRLRRTSGAAAGGSRTRPGSGDRSCGRRCRCGSAGTSTRRPPLFSSLVVEGRGRSRRGGSEHPGHARAALLGMGVDTRRGAAHRRSSPARSPVPPAARRRRRTVGTPSSGGRDRRWRRRGGAGEGCGDAVSGVTREAVDRPRAGPVSQQRTGAGRRVGRAARPARVHHRGSLLAAPRRGHRAAESAHGRSRVMTTAVGEGKEPPRGSGPDRHAPHGEPAAAAARLERDGGHAAFLRFWGPHRRLRCRHTSERGPWSEAAGNRVTACMACDMSMCTPTPCASSGEGGRPPQAPRGAHRTYSPVATRNACCAEDRVR